MKYEVCDRSYFENIDKSIFGSQNREFLFVPLFMTMPIYGMKRANFMIQLSYDNM